MSVLAIQSRTCFEEASGYIRTLERSLENRSKFNNDLLYGIAAMSFEKLFVSLLAHNKIEALHHTPMALFKEANKFKPLPESFRETAKNLQKFESICSFDGFGYRTPQDDELRTIITGLIEIKAYVETVRNKSFAEELH